MQIRYSKDGRQWFSSNLILEVNGITYGLFWAHGSSKIVCRKVGVGNHRQMWWKRNSWKIELPLCYGWTNEQLAKYLLLI